MYVTLVLRTHSSADKVGGRAGLAEGIQEEMEQKDPSWKVSGKYAVVSFSPKT